MSDEPWPTWRAGDAEISIRPPDVCFLGFGLYSSGGGESLSFRQFLENEKAHAAVARFMGRKVPGQVLAAVVHRTPRAWQKGEFSVEVRLCEICVGINDPRGGSGTSWPTAEFLAGAYDVAVRGTFGEQVLIEVRQKLLEFDS